MSALDEFRHGRSHEGREHEAVSKVEWAEREDQLDRRALRRIAYMDAGGRFVTAAHPTIRVMGVLVVTALGGPHLVDLIIN